MSSTPSTRWLEAALAYAEGDFSKAVDICSEIGASPEEAYARLAAAGAALADGGGQRPRPRSPAHSRSTAEWARWRTAVRPKRCSPGKARYPFWLFRSRREELLHSLRLQRVREERLSVGALDGHPCLVLAVLPLIATRFAPSVPQP